MRRRCWRSAPRSRSAAAPGTSSRPPTSSSPNQPEERFNDLSGASRDEFWRVAIDAFGEEPVCGNGAGTYQFAWNQLRAIPLPVLDAHSLYLEAFAELGLVGGLLVLALVGTLLWTGFAAWRGAQRAAAGALRGRSSPPARLRGRRRRSTGSGRSPRSARSSSSPAAPSSPLAARSWRGAPADAATAAERRRFGLAVAGLALAWIAALALVGPLLVDREIDASHAAAADGNIASAVDHADTRALDRALGGLALRPARACWPSCRATTRPRSSASAQAIDREDHNWRPLLPAGAGSSTRPATSPPRAPTSSGRSS